MSDEVFVDSAALRKLAKSFETHAYDLQSHLKSFSQKTGEEAIGDGFGVLTESEEITSSYVDYSKDVSTAMEKVHRHLDEIGAALQQVTRNTETNDDNVSALFGRKGPRSS
ncbi:WXG100 family type VII secretion target [Streptomyces nigrescens]